MAVKLMRIGAGRIVHRRHVQHRNYTVYRRPETIGVTVTAAKYYEAHNQELIKAMEKMSPWQ